MSKDPSGILFYGYSWPYDEDSEGGTDEDSLEVEPVIKNLMAERGQPVHPPQRDHEVSWDQWAEDNKQELDRWRANNKQAKADIGVDFDRQGSWEYAGHYLYVLDSRVEAEWGDAQPIGPVLLIDPGWRDKLDSALAFLNIEPPDGPNQPGWWLTSFYG